ncbi:unnamed protein product [Rotaria sp. Silwood1]|nr:unnamed protein product [Rotaria sp. Silwood1]CAF1552093.1 unnamed protein product [Rotaria sp. Silwood1]
MLLEKNVLIWYILIIIILYILQGFIQGFTTSIPLYLVSYKASWQQQGTFSWVSYPFSFKIVWAPIIDPFQSRRFGRYQTWLVPIQLIIALVYLMTVSCIGFYARISEPRIAGTYMTLLGTISNLGHSLSSTLVLYIANWLPKPYAYSIEVGTCILLGFIWIGLTWRIIRRLDALPVEEWYLEPSLLMINHSTSEEI